MARGGQIRRKLGFLEGFPRLLGRQKILFRRRRVRGLIQGLGGHLRVVRLGFLGTERGRGVLGKHLRALRAG
jgi:hypothetical protein